MVATLQGVSRQAKEFPPLEAAAQNETKKTSMRVTVIHDV
jgi:hypothetical protein